MIQPPVNKAEVDGTSIMSIKIKVMCHSWQDVFTAYICTIKFSIYIYMFYLLLFKFFLYLFISSFFPNFLHLFKRKNIYRIIKLFIINTLCCLEWYFLLYKILYNNQYQSSSRKKARNILHAPPTKHKFSIYLLLKKN